MIEKWPATTVLPPLNLDHNAMAACRMNNESLYSVTNPDDIPKDGNVR